MTSLYSKRLYLAEIACLIDTPIREFDISKANISVLRDANAISEDLYQELFMGPKMKRSITIGKLQGQNPRISEVLKQGIENARRIFLQANNIDDNEVLAINNDSITIIGNKPIRVLDITERVRFRLDGEYTSYYLINQIGCFYFYDRITGIENIRVKGMGEDKVALHREYLLDFFKELFYTAQIDGIIPAMDLLNNFYNLYITKELPIEYCREFNAMSRYRMISEMSMVSTMFMDWVTEIDRKYVNDATNMHILLDLNRMLYGSQRYPYGT